VIGLAALRRPTTTSGWSSARSWRPRQRC